MNESSLTGSQVAIEVSEPWELAREEGSPPVIAVVGDVRTSAPGPDADALLLHLADPLEFEGASYDRLVARARDGSSSFDPLLDGLTVEANCYGIPAGEQLDDPFDHGWWRGGLGLVGTLRTI